MDGLSKLSREAQVVLGGGVLLFILSFLDWHKVGPIGWDEWHGIGTLAALLVIAMLAWEIVRVMGANVSIGTLSPGLVSVGLALLMALFTVIAALTADFRNWPAWIALIVALVVAAMAVMRARADGVQMPQVSSGNSGAPAAPPASAPPAAPADSTDDSSE